VFPVNEIVFYGITPGDELGPGGEHLEPQDYHAKLGQSNTVVIDVRNNYEAEIGRFQKVSESCTSLCYTTLHLMLVSF
jgi:predicted sulfurtransferase